MKKKEKKKREHRSATSLQIMTKYQNIRDSENSAWERIILPACAHLRMRTRNEYVRINEREKVGKFAPVESRYVPNPINTI